MMQKDERLSLAERLRDRIRAHGPITFAEFMREALYHPDQGFYAGLPVGERGDFVTSPHISPAFGRLLAVQVEDFWERLGRPEPFTVIEVGAGDGTLAGQLLGSLPTHLRSATRFLAVEQSAAGRKELRRRNLPGGASIVGRLDEVRQVEAGCLLANEVLDNLPFHRVRNTRSGPVELCVGIGERGFVLIEQPPSAPEIERLAATLPPRREGVISVEALRFLDHAAAVLRRGYLWIADYAAPKDGGGAQVHGYRGHRLEADVLEDPGSRDITAGVDFDALVDHARNLGLAVFGPMTQRAALMALGFRDLARQGRSRQVEALGDGRGLDALRAYSDRTRADLLVDPGRLGRFTWLFLGVGIADAPKSIRPPEE